MSVSVVRLLLCYPLLCWGRLSVDVGLDPMQHTISHDKNDEYFGIYIKLTKRSHWHCLHIAWRILGHTLLVRFNSTRAIFDARFKKKKKKAMHIYRTVFRFIRSFISSYFFLSFYFSHFSSFCALFVLKFWRTNTEHRTNLLKRVKVSR